MEFHLIGNITARNDATLITRNAKLVLSPRGEVVYLEAVLLRDRSKFIAENTTILFQPLLYDVSEIAVDDEAQANITDSKLAGWAYIISRKYSRVCIKNTSMKGPNPEELFSCGVISEDSSLVRIQNSTLDHAGARGESSIYIAKSIVQPRGASAGGNGTIEIVSSDVGTCQFLWDNSTLRISNSTITEISFEGSVLYIQDSHVQFDVLVYRNSTAWLKRTSVSRVQAYDKSIIWLINSATTEINTFDEGKVYVGWQLPILGTLTLPHTWVPILQGALFLAIVIIIITSIVFLNRRWKQWQLKRMGQEAVPTGSRKSD